MILIRVDQSEVKTVAPIKAGTLSVVCVTNKKPTMPERVAGSAVMMMIKAGIRHFAIAYKGPTAHRSSKGHREAWIGLSDCPRQLEHCRDRLKDPPYMRSFRAEPYVSSCVRYRSA
jgi:hypothetical protein